MIGRLAPPETATLPQVSDALLVMVQFKTALGAFAKRHMTSETYYGDVHWATEERLLGKAEEYSEHEDYLELEDDGEDAE